MAIYFYNNLVMEALKALKDSHELLDVSQDLEEVQRQMEQIKYSSLILISNDERYRKLQQARELTGVLREKYPTINQMLNIANKFPQPQSSYFTPVSVSETEEYENLRQDYYGILCNTLLKKELIRTIDQFIERVG